MTLSMYLVTRIDCMTRIRPVLVLTYAEYRLAPSIPCWVEEQGLSPLLLRTPASTLPTRFPAALGIGHG